MKTIEAWKKEKETPDWLYAATIHFAKWAEHQEVTEKQYDEATKACAEQPLK